jgi:AraC-like DNA-binding protein/tetratricopeptide (TPR) repeat protein/TolB-like protein
MTEILSGNQIFISKLTEIVLENLRNENFSVKELAQSLNMSHYGLSRKLFMIKGKKVSQFMREVRLMKALELLQSGDKTASEVAYNVGFSSPAYFNKCFHDHFGYPPGKITRKESIDKEDKTAGINAIEDRSGKRHFKRSLIKFPGILIIILLMLIGFFVLKRMSVNPDSTDKRISIAVLPFQNRTNDTIWNVWEEGLQESFIAWLSNSKELKVTRKEEIHAFLSTQSNAEYASVTPFLAAELSNKLNAGMFIYGCIIEAGSSIRLTAELINTKTKEVLKSFEIKTPVKGEINFEIIDSLRTAVTDFLLVSKLIIENPWLKNLPIIGTDSPEALKDYIYGYRAYYKGDWAVSRNWFLKALTVDSNYVDAMSKIYSTCKNLGKTEEAMYWLLKLYKISDQMPQLNQLYTKWLYSERFEATEIRIKYLRQLQEIDDQGNYYYLIGAMYVKAKQFEKAVPEHEKYLEISRKRGKAFLKDNWVYPALGEVYHLTGQYRKAKKLYKEACEVNNDHNSVYFSWIIRDMGSLSLTEGDTVAANEYIREYISVRKGNSSSDADIAEGLGDMYWLAKKWDKGEEYYRKALSLEPEDPSRMNALANRLIDRNRNLSEVTELMNKALERASTKYDYYNYSDTKGYALYKAGKYQEALDILQKTWDETPFKFYALRSHLEQVKKAIGSK